MWAYIVGVEAFRYATCLSVAFWAVAVAHAAAASAAKQTTTVMESALRFKEASKKPAVVGSR
jgi:hypothetical protein